MERRKYHRINDTLLLELDNGYGMVLDMSIQGMRVTPDVMPEHRHIDLRLKINGRAIILKGEICWHSEVASLTGQPEIGIRLTEIPDSYRKFITGLMSSPEHMDEEHRLDQIFENRYSVTINPDALIKGEFELHLPERELPVHILKGIDEDGALEDIFAS